MGLMLLLAYRFQVDSFHFQVDSFHATPIGQMLNFAKVGGQPPPLPSGSRVAGGRSVTYDADCAILCGPSLFPVHTGSVLLRTARRVCMRLRMRQLVPHYVRTLCGPVTDAV